MAPSWSHPNPWKLVRDDFNLSEEVETFPAAFKYEATLGVSVKELQPSATQATALLQARSAGLPALLSALCQPTSHRLPREAARSHPSPYHGRSLPSAGGSAGSARKAGGALCTAVCGNNSNQATCRAGSISRSRRCCVQVELSFAATHSFVRETPWVGSRSSR